MNGVVISLTRRSLLGKRRAALLLLLPVLLLIVAGLVAWRTGGEPEAAANVIQMFGLGTLLPLTCLLIGTGVIGPEIEDQSVVYILAKPVKRLTIVLSKLVVAYTAALVFAIIPTALATWIASGGEATLALAMGVASALASLAYIALFFTLAILTRNAVIIGLMYALLWESVLGGFAPGVRALSVRHWSLAPAEQIAGADAGAWGIASDVGLGVGLVAIAVVVAASLVLSTRRLARLQLRSAD